MLGTAVLASIAQQMMSSNAVDVNGKPVPVSRTSGHRLRTLPFTMDGREYQAIEQNAEKPSHPSRFCLGGDFHSLLMMAPSCHLLPQLRVLSDANLGRGRFGRTIPLYIPGTSVSWWNGDIHLPFCFCQSEVAITFPACFLPLQVASWVAV